MKTVKLVFFGAMTVGIAVLLAAWPGPAERATKSHACGPHRQ